MGCTAFPIHDEERERWAHTSQLFLSTSVNGRRTWLVSTRRLTEGESYYTRWKENGRGDRCDRDLESFSRTEVESMTVAK